MSNLSDFDRMVGRLHHWGLWGLDLMGRPDSHCGNRAIYDMGKQDERELDPDAAPEPVNRIDVRDCEFLDVLIAQKIGRTHRNVIKDFFYKRRPRPRLDVDAAVRAVLDAEYIALELGWAA